ncbi:NADH-quinone oxidoreductase subunit NuoE [bacterium]|nr:NADH-quinone oxidoreductase subunit NuoE [bacterium]
MEAVHRIIENYGKRDRSLIAMLQDIQREKGYLPREALKIVADEVNVPLSRLYSLATFYKAFSLVPRGRHIVHVCTGTACHVRGAVKLIDKLEQTLEIKNGETTADGRFTLEEVRCVGCCGLAPVIVIDEEFHGKLTQKDVGKVLEKYE